MGRRQVASSPRIVQGGAGRAVPNSPWPCTSAPPNPPHLTYSSQSFKCMNTRGRPDRAHICQHQVQPLRLDLPIPDLLLKNQFQCRGRRRQAEAGRSGERDARGEEEREEPLRCDQRRGGGSHSQRRRAEPIRRG
jgi:hypothetical protein